jgi:glycosyltransferase involved in cell wall biosynthesis
MIDITTYDEGLPVSVIVPHGRTKIRDDFFSNFVYPLIEANEPIEIIVNDNIGTAPKKRNEGFKKSTQPYVFFCDNDILLPKNYIKSLLNVLEKNPNKGYAYTGYYGIVKDVTNHPLKGNFKIPTMPFNGNTLKSGNYISTMSLMRREHFPFFDETLKRLQDWDIYLTLLENGIEGISVDNMEFFAYYLDEGITSNTNNEREAYMRIIEKHKLL